jgi:hypothetical protein
VSDAKGDSKLEALICAATTAWRHDDAAGNIAFHPAWHDLDAQARERVYELARALRALEAGLDAAGLSTTARAVLAKIKSSR